ncbi:GIN domain-containing protein [Rickettsiella endosymbiont of Miltochrista miniata]|uniref:GIN domain-containing protein n=1 Tax=Rickettsiella endosymbiont of Miltochrista miniata TaxID=3066239 RepID=UPI00313BB2F0
MKIIAYCLLISLSLFSILGHAQLPPHRASIICKNISINDFDSLDIQGPVNVYIDATQTHTSLQILGDPKRVLAVTYSEKNRILYLGTKPVYRSAPGERLTIRINTSPAQIKQIQFDSNATLFGKGLSGSLTLRTQGAGQINLYTNKLNLKSLYSIGNENIIFHNILSSNLNIEAHNSHNIVLQGIVSLNKINFTGNGNLQVYWVNSPYLRIDAKGKGKIDLAGIVKTVDIQLTQDIRLFAQHLRTQQGFVKTEKHVQANVNARNTLRAFAKDNSVIYYSTPINFISKYSEGQGLVLNKN